MSVTSQAGRILYSSYNVTATTDFVYNSYGGSYATSGVVDCRSDNIVVQVNCTPLNASSFTYRIEGRQDTINRWSEIYTETSATPFDLDKAVVVLERFKDLRVGVKVGNNASPNTFNCGVVLTDVK